MEATKPGGRTDASNDAPGAHLRDTGAPARRRRHWLSLIGGTVGLVALVRVLAGLDHSQLRAILAEADPRYMALVPLAFVAEQLVRAWKWRQILHSLRSIGTLRLFGSVMAGYLANLLVLLELSPLVRSWLVVRLEALTMSAVLASVAIDGLIDGVVEAFTLWRHGVALGALRAHAISSNGPA